MKNKIKMLKVNFSHGALTSLKCLLGSLQFIRVRCIRRFPINEMRHICIIVLLLYLYVLVYDCWWLFKFWQLSWPSRNVRYLFFFKDASVAEKEDVFGLDGQIEHKLAFLRKHVPQETLLLLIGHSIGCYIILEMMKRDPELKVF